MVKECFGMDGGFLQIMALGRDFFPQRLRLLVSTANRWEWTNFHPSLDSWDTACLRGASCPSSWDTLEAVTGGHQQVAHGNRNTRVLAQDKETEEADLVQGQWADVLNLEVLNAAQEDHKNLHDHRTCMIKRKRGQDKEWRHYHHSFNLSSTSLLTWVTSYEDCKLKACCR